MATQIGILFCVSYSTMDKDDTSSKSCQDYICGSFEDSEAANPSFHLVGSGILLLLIVYICQIPSATKDTYTAFFSLACNLTCFMVSFICHWTFNTTKKSPVIYFRLDHVGIILHIWATSLTVLILEITDCGKYSFGASGITLAGLIACICLFVLPLDKAIRVILIGGFGGLSFLVVLTLVLASGRFSRLSASYFAMVMINSVRGWGFLQNSNSGVRKILARHCLMPGNSFMHACSLLASAIHAMVLVYFVSRGPLT